MKEEKKVMRKAKNKLIKEQKIKGTITNRKKKIRRQRNKQTNKKAGRLTESSLET